MKFDKKQLLLYAVTDSRWLQGASLIQQVEAALKGGVTMVQLREKNMDEESFKQEALALKTLCQQYQVPLIINDNVKLAKEIDADGVHIGQQDCQLETARALLGPDKIIGVSARTLAQAQAAYEGGADYLGVGAVFSTTTKNDASTISYETLKAITHHTPLPVVAIGGISLDNMLSLIGSGIAGIAVVSALFASKEIIQDAKELKARAWRLVHPQLHTALTIAGSDCSGGAGIQADIKTMLANRVYAMSVITVLTAQNTTGVSAIYEVTPEFLKQQMDSVFQDIYPEAIKIGMVSSHELIIAIAQKLKQYQARHIVVDPVMVATSGAKLISDEAITALKEYLFPLAQVITPNILEAQVLSGMDIKNEADMIAAAKKIYDLYGCAVLVKGGHQVNDANDLLYEKGNYQWFKGKRIFNDNTHGTGCTLSSAIASYLARGSTLEEAVDQAKKYISGALNAMLDLGNGSGPMDHGYVLDK